MKSQIEIIKKHVLNQFSELDVEFNNLKNTYDVNALSSLTTPMKAGQITPSVAGSNALLSSQLKSQFK